MKINSISFINFNLKNKKFINKSKEQNRNNNNSPISYFSTKNYLSFLGGKSLSLKETFESLSKDAFPFDIKEMVEEELSLNPNTSKTLYDVHFEKYKGINDCFSLKELKEKYPEFNNVISSKEILSKDDSFIGRFKNNQLKLFSNDKDLTLELIKLYWGQGFSLKDLSRYFSAEEEYSNGINLYYTIAKKLNIPLMDRQYAVLLKLSNKEYNERFIEYLKERAKEAREAKEQMAEGESVIIPKGSLTLLHRQHISESLKKHYQQNPEKIYKMSQRQKTFWQENPKEKEKLSYVMEFAWNKTLEGKGLRKDLSKFFRKHNITDEELFLRKELPKTIQDLLSDFWLKNPWACKKFSIATTKAWDFYKNLDEYYSGINKPKEKVLFRAYPKTLEKELIEFIKREGYDDGRFYPIKYLVVTNGDVPKNIEKYSAKFQQFFDKFYSKYPAKANKEADARIKAILNFEQDIKTRSPRLPQRLKEDELAFFLYEDLFNQIEQETPISYSTKKGLVPRSSIDLSLLQHISTKILDMSFDIHGLDIADYFHKLFEEAYESI